MGSGRCGSAQWCWRASTNGGANFNPIAKVTTGALADCVGSRLHWKNPKTKTPINCYPCLRTVLLPMSPAVPSSAFESLVLDDLSPGTGRAGARRRLPPPGEQARRGEEHGRQADEHQQLRPQLPQGASRQKTFR